MISHDESWQHGLERLAAAMKVPLEDCWSAKATINSLRQGSPPMSGVERLTVDLDDVRMAFARKLQVTSSGGCSFTLLNGSYGVGKSHCLCLLRETALQKGFLVSYLTLSPRECPLHDLGAIYRSIAHRIEGQPGASVDSLQDLLDSWTSKVRAAGQRSRDEAKRAVRSLHPDFKTAIAEYLHPTRLGRDYDAARWLMGDDSTKRTARSLGVELRATNEKALFMLNDMGKLAKAIGFAGLVILLDEAEAIPAYEGNPQQQQCYTNLCRLIKGSERIPHCYFVYATTPAFFAKCKGHVPLSEESEVVLTPPILSVAHLRELGCIVRDFYMKGEDWQGWQKSVDDHEIARCVAAYGNHSHGAWKPRGFVRALVAAMDVCATNPREKLSSIFQSIPDEC